MNTEIKIFGIRAILCIVGVWDIIMLIDDIKSNGNYNTEYAHVIGGQGNNSYGKSNAYVFNSHQSVLPYLGSRTFYNSDKNVTVTFRWLHLC